MKRPSVCDNEFGKSGDKAKAKQRPVEPEHPASEDEYGGGDICSPEQSPSTDDDKPLA